MDDDLSRAVHKQRLKQRQGAQRVQTRQRQQLQLAEDLACSPLVQPSSSSSSLPAPVKQEIAPALDLAEADEDIILPGGAFTCFICIEEKAAEERFLPHQCSVTPSNLCCRPCFVDWISSQIDSEAPAIKCCHCDAVLGVRALSRVVKPEHLAKHCETALQRSLKQDATFIWCSKCPSGGWVDPQRPSSACGWSCPECSNSFVYCRYCRREHGTISCKRFQQLRHEIFTSKSTKQDGQSEGAVARNSKSCPSCHMPIQKEGGCKFMDCPNCSRQFCWNCGRLLKKSHQKHVCDAGIESSTIVKRSPNGHPCVEITRLFTNIIDIDSVDLLNTEEPDLQDLKAMLTPGLTQETRSPFFVGPSQCDGEIIIVLPFNFVTKLNWDLTHVLIKATHPPTPHSYPPRWATLLTNTKHNSFSDFDDPTARTVEIKVCDNGILLIPLEQFRSKGTFRKVTTLAMRLSVHGPLDGDGNSRDHDDDEAEVFLNDLALFGLPGDITGPRTFFGGPVDELIVSPAIVKNNWGEEAENDTDAHDVAG